LKKMAILTLTPEALREFLELPEGAEVVRVELEYGYRGVLKLVIEGAGWDTPEGGPIRPSLTAIVTRHFAEDGAQLSRSINWGLPVGEVAA
jgi:hypothetical protein